MKPLIGLILSSVRRQLLLEPELGIDQILCPPALDVVPLLLLMDLLVLNEPLRDRQSTRVMYLVPVGENLAPRERKSFPDLIDVGRP